MSGTMSDEKVHSWLQEIADDCQVSLHYDSPVLGGVGRCEIEGGGYLRQQVAFSQPSNRAIWSVEDAVFTGLTQNIISHYGLWNSDSLFLGYGLLPERYPILNGKGYIIYAGTLAISFG